MKHIKHVLAIFLICAIIISVTPVLAYAACSHVWTGPFSEASHPHQNFNQCNLCGAKQYTGGYSPKAHGNGAWGSGTCPSCGAHSFIGQSCTTSGFCACGATVSPLGHLLDSATYSDATHPHAYFRYCLRCNAKVYTGGYETKPHGTGSWGSGTCPSCGSHNYQQTTQTVHPHKNTLACACGDVLADDYAWDIHCSSCTANSKQASSSTHYPVVLAYTDSDQGIGVVITVPFTYYVECTMTYKSFYMMDTGTSFASFSVKVSSRGVGKPVWAPQIITVSSKNLKYYNSSGGQLATQSLLWNPNMDAINMPVAFVLNSVPSYTIGEATCSLEGGLGIFATKTTQTNLTY